MADTPNGITDAILKKKAIAVVRTRSVEVLSRVTEAVLSGGLNIIEITMTVPGAIDHIEALSRRFGDEAIIGVGSVTDPTIATRAIAAGAQYVVSPILKVEVIAAAKDNGVVVIPGTFTPSEAQRAYELGADFIKVFPANVLGIEYFKSVLAPLPHLRLVPTGGVTPENAGQWIGAGACCVGIGSALLDREAIASERFEVITEKTRILLDNVASAAG